MHSIFISGAAQGIGAAIATLFYQNGYKVGIYDINEIQAQKLAQQLGTTRKPVCSMFAIMNNGNRL